MAQPYHELLDWQTHCDGLLFHEVLKRIINLHSPYYTQEQLARSAGYHKTWLSHLLAGNRQASHTHVSQIAKAIPSLIYSSLQINPALRDSVMGLEMNQSFSDELEKASIELVLEVCAGLDTAQGIGLEATPSARHIKQILYVSFVCSFLETKGLGEA